MYILTIFDTHIHYKTLEFIFNTLGSFTYLTRQSGVE